MIIGNERRNTSRIIAYAIVAVGIIAYVAFMVLLYTVVKRPELSTKSAVRAMQIVTAAVFTRETPKQVTDKKIAEDIRSHFPSPLQDRRSYNTTIFYYTYPAIKDLQSFGVVGYITGWDSKAYKLTITNIDGQSFVFDLTPDVQKPIIETELILGTSMFVTRRDVTNRYCAFGDLVEVVWDDARNFDEIISDTGKIRAENLSIIRPFLIKFYDRKLECFK